MKELYEKIYSRVGQRDNMHILGQLNVTKTGQTVGGWLVTTWSEGAPYRGLKMHWFEKQNGKLHHPNFKVGIGINFVDTKVEDSSIEPERAKYIHEMIKEWEADWLRKNALG